MEAIKIEKKRKIRFTTAAVPPSASAAGERESEKA
jgi:hypothetical protein